MSLSIDKFTPLHGLATLLTAGSLFYSVGWIGGMIDSSKLPSELFAGIGMKEEASKDSKVREANAVEKVLYKNYVLGLLLTPTITLLVALQSGDRKVERLGSVCVGVANGLYSLHVATSTKSVFKKGMQQAVMCSHGVVAVVCVWETWKRS